MHEAKIKALLEDYANGLIDIDRAIQNIKHFSYENIISAKIDHHREYRSAIPEVIFAAGKTLKDTVDIAKSMYQKSGKFLITKANPQIYDALQLSQAVYYQKSGAIRLSDEPTQYGNILIITAGTSDIFVAEEADATLTYLGVKATNVYDVGVAGIHRLFDNLDLIRSADVIIVIAGMEGALPSVVGGIAPCPVIAVPTSVGYGTSLGGLTALFAMLNSCVPGMAVVNIDNGFGAGCLAYKIVKAQRLFNKG